MIRRTERRARRAHRCERAREDCTRWIKPGDRYLECVASPDHDDLGNVRWWRLRYCLPCSAQFPPTEHRVP